MDPYKFSLVTPSFAPDFERCRLLADSVNRYVEPSIRHYIVVDRRDVGLFRALSNERTDVLAVEDVLPSWIFRVPWARRWWLSLKTLPVRNWILQQGVKLALAQNVDSDVLLFVDSDVAFVRPFKGESFVRDGAVRLLRIPGDANIPSQHPWHHAAARLLGLTPKDYFGARYIGNIVSWRRDNILRLHEHIERTTGQPWLRSVLGQWRFSEYILYGVFVDHVLRLKAGHYHDASNICHEYWEDRPMSGRKTAEFFRSLRDEHVAIMISAKARMAVSDYSHYLPGNKLCEKPSASSFSSEEQVKVTVGIPVHNGERYLKQAIDSILNQTIDGLEIVISDNASTDDTPRICSEYAKNDPRIRYERQDTDRGSYWNFNRVLELARGKYFKWMAHDDMIASTYLDRCVEALDADLSATWCQTRIRLIDSNGATIHSSINVYDDPNAPPQDEHSVLQFDPGGRWGSRTSQDCSRRFAAALMGVAWCLDCFGVIRTEALRKTTGFRSVYGSEKTLIAELSLLGRYVEIPDVLQYIRVHDLATGGLASHGKPDGIADETARQTWLPPRVLLLLDKISAIGRAPLSRRQRLQCSCAVLRYVFQLWRWRPRTTTNCETQPCLPGSGTAAFSGIKKSNA